MSEKRYVVRLTADERAELVGVVKSSKRVAAQKRTRARILLKVDQGEHGPAWADVKVAEAFDVHVNTVKSVRQRLGEEGFTQALNRKKQKHPSVPRKLDGAAEARLIATVQGPPPAGWAKWSLRLLSDKIMELRISDVPVSHTAIWRALKKTS